MPLTAGDLEGEPAGKGATRRHASLLDVEPTVERSGDHGEVEQVIGEDETSAEVPGTPLMAALTGMDDAGAKPRNGAIARLRRIVRLPRSSARLDGTILDAERPQSLVSTTARPPRRTKSIAEAAADRPAASDDAFAHLREHFAFSHGDLAPAGIEGAEQRLSLALSKMQWLAAEIERCQDALTETQDVIHAEELKVSRLRGVEEGIGMARRREAHESEEAEEIRRGIGELRRMLREVSGTS